MYLIKFGHPTRSERRRGIRQQAHVAGTLDRSGHNTLFTGVEAGLLTALDLAVGGHVTTQVFAVFVIHKCRSVAGLEDDFRFNEETFERVIRDYNTKDLAI